MAEFAANIEEKLRHYQSSKTREVENRVEEIRTLLNKCESPAERLFLVEAVRVLDARPMLLPSQSADQYHFAAFPRWGPGLERFIVRIHPQEQIEVEHQSLLRETKHYRTDFLITLERHEDQRGLANRGTFGNTVHARVIVEIDGHDYHERTKEQAKRDRLRDRMFTQAGYVVFRYTGSEVYHDQELPSREVEGFLSQEADAIKDQFGP